MRQALDRRWRPAAAGLLLAASAGLHGCAPMMAVGSGTLLLGKMSPSAPGWVEINQLALAYPVDDVYARLLQDVARDGLVIVENDALSHSLRVSYPFSWLRNMWGGSMKISCVPNEFGTTVTIQGDGRDSPERVRAIGDKVLDQLDRALRRQARTL